MTSSVRQSDGRWRITLKNYGSAETIQFADGTSFDLPEEALRIIEVGK
ncbi:MAG: hypothetical protein IKO65_00255 [Victivallales bacterium]|nr:hypothetical protein [Victivallales bacterium]